MPSSAVLLPTAGPDAIAGWDFGAAPAEVGAVSMQQLCAVQGAVSLSAPRSLLQLEGYLSARYWNPL